MIKSLPIFLTPLTRNPLRLPRISFSQTVACTSLALLGLGCSGPQLHSDLTADPKVLVRKWTLPTRQGTPEAGDHGTEYSSPILVENTLVFGNREVGLISLYPTINQQRWVLPIQNGVWSDVTVDRGSVYFAGGDGYFYSVNLENGRVNWRYFIKTPLASRPTVSNGRVFITTADDTVYAFDAGAGKDPLWFYRRRSVPTATILGASSPLVDGNEVLAGLSDGYMVALSLEEGKLKWEKKLHFGNKFTDVNAHPVLENGVIYIPSYDGSLYALKRQGGDILWKFDAGGGKTVTLEGSNLYLPSSDGTVYCLQKSNGKVLWKFEVDRGTPTQVALTEKYAIFGSSFQYLYAVDKITGKGVYRFNVGYGSGFSTAPALDSENQRLYLLSGGGNLYSFALRQPPRKIRRHGMTDPYEFKSF